MASGENSALLDLDSEEQGKRVEKAEPPIPTFTHSEAMSTAREMLAGLIMVSASRETYFADLDLVVFVNVRHFVVYGIGRGLIRRHFQTKDNFLGNVLLSRV